MNINKSCLWHIADKVVIIYGDAEESNYRNYYSLQDSRKESHGANA